LFKARQLLLSLELYQFGTVIARSIPDGSSKVSNSRNYNQTNPKEPTQNAAATKNATRQKTNARKKPTTTIKQNK
jgi:hypothetical protein